MTIINKLKSSNMMPLLLGSVVGQMILALSSPLLTRLYTPSEIGVFTLFLTVVTIIYPVINLKLDVLIVTVHEEDKVNKLITSSFIISILLNIIAVIVFYLFFDSKILTLTILFFTLFLHSVSNILTAYNNRTSNYKLIGYASFMRALMLVVFQIIFGYLNLSTTALFTAYMLSQLFILNTQFKSILENDQIKISNFLEQMNYKELKKCLLENIHHISYSVPSTLISTLSYSMIIFYITYLYSSQDIGYYSMAMRLLGFPISVVSLNLSKIYMRDASNNWNLNKNVYFLFKKYTFYLTAISITVFGILAFLVVDLFELVLGKNWSEAGVYSLFLIPQFAVRFIVSTLSPTLIIIKKQKYDLLLQIMFLSLTFGVFLTAQILSMNIKVFLLLTSLGFTSCYIVYFFIMMKSLKKSEKYWRDKNEN